MFIPKPIHEAMCRQITRESLERYHPHLMKTLDKLAESEKKKET